MRGACAPRSVLAARWQVIRSNSMPEFRRCATDRSAFRLCDMKTSSYRVVPLPSEIAEAARRKAQAGAPDHAISRRSIRRPVIPAGIVCNGRNRESASSFFHMPPFRRAGPIRRPAPSSSMRTPVERYEATDRYPDDFRSHRVIRAYNSENDMIDAIVVADDQPEPVIEKLLAESGNGIFCRLVLCRRGCYTFKIERQ